MSRWEDRELDLGGASEEVRRLLGRARRRWFTTLALTLAITGLFVFREVRKQRFYESTVVLTATEGEQAEDAVAHTTARLQDYVYHAVFTDSALTELMKKHRYREDLQRINFRLALEQFRDFIDVDLYKNEFVHPRWPGTPPRSARIAISMRYTDPDEALTIARELGDLVIQRDAENRKQRFEAKLRVANDAVNYTKAEIDRLDRELQFSRAVEETMPDLRGEYKVKADGAERSMIAALARLKEAEAERNKLRLASSADDRSLELRFERVEWGAPERRENPALLVVRAALFAFFGLLPIVALTVGAFDPRIYDERDVTRLGLRALGRVSARGNT